MEKMKKCAICPKPAWGRNSCCIIRYSKKDGIQDIVFCSHTCRTRWPNDNIVERI